MPKYAPSPLDPTAREVVERLHARSKRELITSTLPILGMAAKSRLRNGTWDFTEGTENKEWLAGKMVALAPAKAALCHVLCRSIGATRAVEAGTSFGVSTIYLASAVRDTVDARGDGADGRGVVIGTEYEPAKVAAARSNIADAGLSDHVDIRDGDLRETLRDLDGPIDFMLIDIWIPMALPALELVLPALRPGALVVCDNVVGAYSEYRPYLDVVRDPAGEFVSVTVPGNGGLEISMKR